MQQSSNLAFLMIIAFLTGTRAQNSYPQSTTSPGGPDSPGAQACPSASGQNIFCSAPNPFCSVSNTCCCGVASFYCTASAQCCCQNTDGVCCDGFCCSQALSRCCGNAQQSSCCAVNSECCQRPNAATGTTITNECIVVPPDELLPATQEELVMERVEDVQFDIPPPSQHLQIFALPVGQGDCTVIQCPSGNIIFDDCGSSSTSNINNGPKLSPQQVQAFLGDRINNVNTIVITHPDRDHYNYLYQIQFNTTLVQNVIIGGTLDDYDGDRPEEMMIFNWLTQFQNMGKLYTVSNGNDCIGDCTVPISTNFCNNLNINFNILAANEGNTPNQKSIVMKVTLGDFSILLPGDIEGGAATRIAQTLPQQLQSSVYKIAHHGASNQANRATWLQPIQPRSAFASSAYNFGNCRHPRCKAINNILALGTVVPTRPHVTYCGNQLGVTLLNMPNFCRHIFETTPTNSLMCLLTYTSNFQLHSNCASFTSLVEEEVSASAGDVCDEELDEEDLMLGGGGTMASPAYTTTTFIVAAFLMNFFV